LLIDNIASLQLLGVSEVSLSYRVLAILNCRFPASRGRLGPASGFATSFRCPALDDHWLAATRRYAVDG
jgi:hypothetical protein